MRRSAHDVDPAEYGEKIADVYDGWLDGQAAGLGRDTVAEVEFLAARAAGGPALELGIGTGRVALPLAARGIRVVGIDSSPKMVDRMRAKPGGADLPVVMGDFADVDAHVAVAEGPFQLVYVVFNTLFALLTQADQLRCFDGVARRLRPGGAFVVEAFVPDPTRYDRDQRLEVTDLSGGTVRLTASTHDPAEQRVSSRHVAIADGTATVYPIEIRYAWPSELDLMARLAGLRPAGRWGGWRDEPFTSESTRHVSVWTLSPDEVSAG